MGGVRRVAGFVLAALLAAACGGGGTAGNGPIKVGYLVPLTGTFAANGHSEENGFTLGLQDFGDTVDGRKIQPIFVDTMADPNTALSAAHQLIENQNVDMMEGPLAANEIAVVASYVGPRGVPIDDLSLCSAQQLESYVKYGNGLDSGWACNQPSIMGADWAFNDMHYRHVVTIGQDFAFGWEVVGGFATAFRQLGGSIDKMLWSPNTNLDFAPYVSQIPSNTDAVFAELSGQTAVRFTEAYKQFGLKGKVPLFGITQLTDWSAMTAERSDPASVLGLHTDAQYCDGIQTAENQKFADEYHSRFGDYPSYYADTGYAKARLLVSSLKKINGNASDHKALANALRTTPIVAARGPVKLTGAPAFSPVQNIYICEVQTVNGALRNVPIKTYASVPPWGFLSEATWEQQFRKDSVGRPS